MQRYILTDAGNVITRFKFRAQLIAEIMAAFGVGNLNLADIFKTKVSAASDENFYHSLDVGEFSVRDIWERLVGHSRVLKQTCPYPLFLSPWCRHLEPIVGVVRLFKGLQREFPLMVISNGDAEGVRHLVYHLAGAYGLRFEEVFISAERRRKKPDLLSDVITSLRKKDVSPLDCVYIDDLKQYVDAAEELGIPGILFDGSKQPAQKLRRALAELGFRPVS